MKAIVTILNAGSISTNLLLFGYIALVHEIIYDYYLHDPVLDITTRVMGEGLRNELFGTAILVIIGEVVAYTVVIGSLIQNTGYDNLLLAYWHTPAMLALNIVLFAFLFFIFYLPLRLPYFLIEEGQSPSMRRLNYLSFALVCAVAILPLFQGEKSLEGALAEPDETIILYLNGRDLESLPPGIGKLTELQVLHLGYNRLEELPPEFINLRKLQWLNLGGTVSGQYPGRCFCSLS